MRVGIVLPTDSAGVSVESVVKVAQAAERLGNVSETSRPGRPTISSRRSLRVASTPRPSSNPDPSRRRRPDRAHSPRVSVVAVPHRNGIVLAKALATLDHLFGGRLVVGMGAGWNEYELQMLGAAERFH